MSGYEVEHNISPRPQERARRPDLSTLFSTIEQAEQPEGHTNEHALPLPEMVTATYREGANAFLHMMQERGAEIQPTRGDYVELLGQMVELLRALADDPPEKLKGVPDSFFDELDRVPKKSLKKDDDCPICGNPFLEDEYPLVVSLPCHKDHKFDMECIRPWLKLNSTCPLDRKELLKKKAPPPPPDDEEEDCDDYYA